MNCVADDLHRCPLADRGSPGRTHGNPLERILREIRRRTRVVGAFCALISHAPLGAFETGGGNLESITNDRKSEGSIPLAVRALVDRAVAGFHREVRLPLK
jgi:hypothetical protein